MIKETITISNPTGLHTRPAKRLVSEAKKFNSEITFIYKEKEASAKSLLKIMKLGLSQNNQLELVCNGDDEEQAFAKIKDFLIKLED